MSSPVPWADARSRIEAAALGVPIQWPNEPFDVPAMDAAGIWLSVDSTSGMIDPIEIGGSVWQEEGTLYVEVIAPRSTGSSASRTLAKQITNLFRGLPPQPVVYLSAAIQSGGRTERDGMWWVLTASIDWRYQDIGS